MYVCVDEDDAEGRRIYGVAFGLPAGVDARTRTGYARYGAAGRRRPDPAAGGDDDVG